MGEECEAISFSSPCVKKRRSHRFQGDRDNGPRPFSDFLLSFFPPSLPTHDSQTVWPAHGPPIPAPRRILRACLCSLEQSLRATTVQRVEHVAIGAGSALRIPWVQHVANVQSTALGSTGRRGGRRRHTAWLGSAALRDGLSLGGGHATLVGSHGGLVGLHGRVRGTVRRGGMARIIVVGRGRRGASVVRRWRVGVRAWRGVRLVSGGGPSGRHGSKVGGIGILKARVRAAAVSRIRHA